MFSGFSLGFVDISKEGPEIDDSGNIQRASLAGFYENRVHPRPVQINGQHGPYSKHHNNIDSLRVQTIEYHSTVGLGNVSDR